jgi:hypothetical protein
MGLCLAFLGRTEVNDMDACKYCGGKNIKEETFKDVWKGETKANVCQTCRGVQ